MAAQTDETRLAVLTQRVEDLRDDVKEVKNMVSNKIATTQYVNDRVDPLRKLVYWLLGLVGTFLILLIIALVSLVWGKR